MKKAVSLLLAATTVFTMALPAMAYVNEADQDADAKVFQYDGHGQYTLVSRPAQRANATLDNQTTGDYIVAAPTVDEEIFQVTDEQFLIQAYDDIYVIYDQVEIDTKNFEANNAIFAEYDIDDETIAEMRAVIEAEEGNDQFSLVMYANSNESPGTYNYTYKNNKFRDIITKEYNRNILHQVRGSQAKTQANQLKDVIVSLVGLGSQSFSILSTGVTLLKYFESSYGTVVKGTGQDYFDVKQFYDRLVKKTYQNTVGSNYMLGCTSFKLWIGQLETDQFYYDINNRKQSSRLVNITKYTKSWDNAAEVCMKNVMLGGVVDANYSYKVGTTTYQFG